MKSFYSFAGFFIVPLFALICTLQSHASEAPVEKIFMASGCEDFAFDNFKLDGSAVRLIVSCDDRRSKDTEEQNGLYSFDLETHEFRKLSLQGISIESFHPHGISLQKFGKSLRLYVINHQSKKESSKHIDFSQVLVFDLNADTLVFREDLSLAEGSSSFESPNDLTVLENGVVYMSNSLSFQKSVLCYTPDDKKWTSVLSGFVHANGVHATQDSLYVNDSASGTQLFFQLDSSNPKALLNNPKVLGEKLGAIDNFCESDAGDLLFGGSTTLAEFLRYNYDPSYQPKSRIFRWHENEKALQILDIDLQKIVSAPSVAFEYKDRLYLGQVFGDFLTVIRNPIWKKFPEKSLKP